MNGMKHACWVLFFITGCSFHDIRPNTPAMQVPLVELEQEVIPVTERYYMIVFGSQSSWKRPKYTHTWATVIRVNDPDCGPHIDLEPHTISWMPKALDIKTWNLLVEPGINLDLDKTIELMKKSDQRISIWGPYEIRPGLYKKFLMQKEFLESGEIGYQCVDTTGEAAWRRNGCDCIHAITDADVQFDRRLYHLRRYGETASEFIVQQCFERGVLIKPETTHDWLIDRLGLQNHKINHRKYNGWSISADEFPPLAPTESARPLGPARF